ncbi:MAG: hypothetical protein BJ554DRAFT_4820 [Olpidium bornovanus]|uniref:Uncharacterized protein n=1 Tax=Olpidium bornovanus TaxID=278681 RepID=A0A8H7ZLB4_9FUNG|nr:MAG: hypothetical protein BJ554DRAFT_4820 [Olpidium bornovanus]
MGSGASRPDGSGAPGTVPQVPLQPYAAPRPQALQQRDAAPAHKAGSPYGAAPAYNAAAANTGRGQTYQAGSAAAAAALSRKNDSSRQDAKRRPEWASAECQKDEENPKSRAGHGRGYESRQTAGAPESREEPSTRTGWGPAEVVGHIDRCHFCGKPPVPDAPKPKGFSAGEMAMLADDDDAKVGRTEACSCFSFSRGTQISPGPDPNLHRQLSLHRFQAAAQRKRAFDRAKFQRVNKGGSPETAETQSDLAPPVASQVSPVRPASASALTPDDEELMESILDEIRE